MPKSFRAFYALHRAHTAIFKSSDKWLKTQEGILTAHQSILFILCVKNGIPSSDLASRAGISKSRLTGLIDTLILKGFVRRERSDQDGRQKLIFIQPEGRAVIDRTKSAVNRMNARLLKDFTEDEQAIIQRFLETTASKAESILDVNPI